MNTQPVHDLGGFYHFVGEKLRNGEVSLSPEQALEEWRLLQPDPIAAEADCAAIQEAIDDIEQGDAGVLLEEFNRDFRAHHNLPSKS